MSDQYSESVGLLKTGTIISYDASDGTLTVRLNLASAIMGQQSQPVTVQAPHSLFMNNGLFIGTLPVPGTPVVVGQGRGGEYHFVSFLAEHLPTVPDLDLGTLLIRSNDDTVITLDLNDNILIGSPVNNIHINTDSNYISTNFYNEYNFTQGSRKITGVVKRDLILNKNFSQSAKLESDRYDSQFKIVGMDPKIPTNSSISGSSKNPPFVESRELIYEFQYLSSIEDDLTESTRYGKSQTNTNINYNLPNRRVSRADTLSLSLVSPNYLMETIKGTVVDIFGNLLDLNRLAIPVGVDNSATIRSDKTKDPIKSFLSIKELERKSLAYHFEINARKDLIGKSGAPAIPDIKSNADYARTRSRFFLDIDKEGQFKLNVPASSEKGNIPLLTRYENYSTFSDDDNKNPNKLIWNKDELDIYQDSFSAQKLDDAFMPVDNGKGSIKLVGNDGKDALSAPKDRITERVIRHGTAYHDILQTCFIFQNPTNQFITYPSDIYIREGLIQSIPILTNIASDQIVVSGDNAKAGGRSGSINFDGSIEMNIGANTIDRQSLWVDTAGSAVINVGRDINGRSVVSSYDGDFIMQVGGFGIKGDSRFNSQKNGIQGAVLDIRILTPGNTAHMIRCDAQGITILSPGNIAIHADGALELTSDSNIKIKAPQVSVQDRVVLNGPLMSI